MFNASASKPTTTVASSNHRSTRSSSISSSSVVTVKRSASLSSTGPTTRPSTAPFRPHSPTESHVDPANKSSLKSRRRSSVAHVAIGGLNGFREGIGNLNRWSQSTSSSKSSAKDKGHSRRESFSRRLSIGGTSNFAPFNGSSALPASPSKKNPKDVRKSPTASPQRLQRSRSPGGPPPNPLTSLPPLSTLPLLPATVYDANSPSTVTTAVHTPSTAGLYTPSTQSSPQPDYFSTRPSSSHKRPITNSSRPARSPLASPPLGEVQKGPKLGEPFRPYSRDGSKESPKNRSHRTVGSREERTHRAAGSREERTHKAAGSREERSHRTPESREERNHRATGSREELEHRRDWSNSENSLKLDDGRGLGTPPRQRERRERNERDKKVLLDNAQNFEGAMEAYEDACKLLKQVMVRSTSDEDKRKLESIRITYTSRIQELRQLDPEYQHAEGKSLPARPMSHESTYTETQSILLDAVSDEEAVIQTATITRIVNDKPPDSHEDQPEPLQSMLAPIQVQGPRESIFTSTIRAVETMATPSTTVSSTLRPPDIVSSSHLTVNTSPLESPMDRGYMPPPLSPRIFRPTTPSPAESRTNLDEAITQQAPHQSEPEPNTQAGSEQQHARINSSESMSWLDTIDESGSSCSSVHSVVSKRGIQRKHLRVDSGDTEAEFDAALDAAVEAAYGDELEPYLDDEEEPQLSGDSVATAWRRNVELAKENVRIVEREEAVRAAQHREREKLLRNEPLPHVRDSVDLDYRSDEAEDEERLLDEMTKEYLMDGFDFGLQSKSALPRQSDSSNYSGSTWNSSMSSNRTTAGTSLSTVAEIPHSSKRTSQAPLHLPPPLPPPTTALPSVTEAKTTSTHPEPLVQPPIPGPRTSSIPPTSVRNRRLSGQNLKQLKIETSSLGQPPQPAPLTQQPGRNAFTSLKAEVPQIPKSAHPDLGASSLPPDSMFKVPGAPASQTHTNQPGSAPPTMSPPETSISPATPFLSQLTKVNSNDSNLAPPSPGGSRFPSKFSASGLRKNKSSLSLKNRTLSISSPEGSEASVGTPMSTTFTFSTVRKSSSAGLAAPTPSVPAFQIDGVPVGGLHLFESDIHSPYSPGSPNPLAVDAPIPLEPCPESYLLRPFWLMRCFYQTLAHPRGGYITTKQFIPRDVWTVKGVKIKAQEEKIANCDLLSAALGRLANVDTFDADAVLEEMQALELVLDQVQATLNRKLGSEVGVHSIGNLFKDAPSSMSPDGDKILEPKSAVSTSKSYLSSWRKLRSKNSAVGLSSIGAHMASVANSAPREQPTLETLPMTNLPNVRFAKRDVNSLRFEGPNAAYMASLAKLFDAVQVLDQIARQVEDPGLKHSSPTHVGLELSTRHAAEFFGFYVCRFVITDVGLMLDKFIKRGSEWVLV
ncbi:hypothetical protein M501DRAFT_1008807 [Patellaria atrata CBS 101060]|uniref:MIT domain-containing protein n=1 Tax=Patellaria atrata CBS 101060 TaxID=1346257 RepID=A0A9P4S2I6_9PEZI|nr:hypothetical protein M501DRAFT_1008807 [Patellaria atrata CBS 101060]